MIRWECFRTVHCEHAHTFLILVNLKYTLTIEFKLHLVLLWNFAFRVDEIFPNVLTRLSGCVSIAIITPRPEGFFGIISGLERRCNIWGLYRLINPHRRRRRRI